MAVKHFEPRDYQRLMAAHIIDNPRCNIWAGMGLGKTAGTLTAIDALRLAGDLDDPVLVLAPLRVAQSTWPDEVAKWHHTEHLKIVPIVGTAKQRQTALFREADIYTINYENIPWLVQEIQKRNRWPYGMIVADESTKLKGFRLRQGAKRARELARVAFKSARFVNLTGTPAPNGLIDLWGQNWFVDAGKRLGRTFTAFRDRWFQRSFDGYSVDPLDHSQAEIAKFLKDVTLSLDPANYFDLEKPIENPIYVDLPPRARKIYDEMEATMFAELDEAGFGTIEAVNAAARTQKCLQLANGAAYVNGENKEWKEIHDVKLKALEDVIEEAAGMPVLVAYHFKSDLARLQKHFKKGRVLDKDPKTIKEWNAGEIPILFAHPQSSGHGLNLQDGSNILCFFSLNWNLEHHEQIIERIGAVRQLQAGHNRPVFIHYIMARDTVESLVMARLKGKAAVQKSLMDAMKIREDGGAIPDFEFNHND